VPQYVLRPTSTPHKSRSVKAYLTDLTAYRDKIFASLACYRTRRIGKFPCGLLRTKNHHFAPLRFPDFQRWMLRFHGVATKYLENYLGWRRGLERWGQKITPSIVLQAAVGRYGHFQLLTQT